MAHILGRQAVTALAASALLIMLATCSPAPAAKPDDPRISAAFAALTAKSGRMHGYLADIETHAALADLFSATDERHVDAAEKLAGGDRDSAVAILEVALSSAAADKRQERTLLRQIGALTYADGDEKAVSAYTQLMELEPSGSTAYLLMMLHLRNGRPDEGEATARKAIEISRNGEEIAKGSSLLMLSIITAGKAPIISGRPDFSAAVDLANQALDIGKAIKDPVVQSQALIRLAQIAAVERRFSEAEQEGREALSLAETTGRPDTIASALFGLGYVLDVSGQKKEAAKYWDRADRIDEEQGFDLERAVLLGEYGMSAYRAGDLATARDRIERSLDLLSDPDFWMTRPGGLYNLHLVLKAQGDRAGAISALEEAGPLFRKAGQMSMAERVETAIANLKSSEPGKP